MRSVNASSTARSATLTGLRLAAVYHVKVTPFSSLGPGLGLSNTIRTQGRNFAIVFIKEFVWKSLSFNNKAKSFKSPEISTGSMDFNNKLSS